MSISILGKTTLESGVVVLRTSVGEFAAKGSRAMSADDACLELMFRCFSTWRVFVADSVADYKAGNKKLWRARNHYNDARDLALLYMAREHGAIVCIEMIGDNTVFFTNTPGLKK